MWVIRNGDTYRTDRHNTWQWGTAEEAYVWSDYVIAGWAFVQSRDAGYTDVVIESTPTLPLEIPCAAIAYGAICQKCNDYCPDAEKSITFVCWSCRRCGS